MGTGLGNLFLLVILLQTTQLDDIASSLDTTAEQIDIAFVASLEKVERSLQKTNTTRGILGWGVALDDGALGDMLVHISPDALKEKNESGLLENCLSWSEVEDLKGISKVVVHDSAYGARVNRTDDNSNWELSVFKEKSGNIIGLHPLRGMVKMLPFKWSLRELMEHTSARFISLESDIDNADLLVVEFELNISAESSPFGQPFQGSWKMYYDNLRKCIGKQEFILDDGNGGIVYEYKFEEGSSFPISFEHTDEFLSNGEKHQIKTLSDFLLVSSKHAMPDEACTLPFFGLPEPIANASQATKSGRWWVFALLLLVIGAVVLRISRRGSSQ